MDLCSSGHEEICYESRKCPLCIEIAEREATEKELEIVKESRNESNDKIEQLITEIEELKNAAPENSGSPAN
jgi:hypothetical protein